MPALRFPADLLLRLSPARLHALFATYGYPPGVDAGTRSLAAIAEGLGSPKLPAKLATALRTLRTMSVDAGEDALIEAAIDRGVDVAAWPAGETHVDRVARMLADDSKDKRGVMARAMIHVRRAPHPAPFRLFRAAANADASANASLGKLDSNAIRRFEHAVRAWLAAHGYAPYARVVARRDGEQHVLEIVRGGRARAMLAIIDGKESRVAVTPAVTDVIRLDAAAGRLAVSTTARGLAGVYRAAVGREFFGDAAWFSARASCSLERLLRQGQEALACPALAARIERVRVIHLQWDAGRDHVRTFFGRDVLASLATDGVHMKGGQIVAATLRIRFADGANVDVELRLPHRVQWTPSPPHDALIAEYLDAVAITGAGASAGAGAGAGASPGGGRGDGTSPVGGGAGGANPPLCVRLGAGARTWVDDAWSLGPNEPRESHWRAAYGDAAVEALLARGVLERGEARAVVDPEQPDGARALIAFDVAGAKGARYAVPEHGEEARARTLSARELSVTRLLPEAWAREVSAALAGAIANGAKTDGATAHRGPRELDARPGLFDLGALTVASFSVQPFLAALEPSPRGLADELRRIAMPGHAVLLVPPGRRLGVGVAEVEVTLGGPHHELLRATVHALGLAPHVDVWLAAPRGVRVAVDVAGGLFVVDGVAVALPELRFKLAARLARAGGAVVPTRDLDEHLSPTRSSGVAKETKLYLVRSVRDALARAGRDPSVADALIATEGGGYRLMVPCFVR